MRSLGLQTFRCVYRNMDRYLIKKPASTPTSKDHPPTKKQKTVVMATSSASGGSDEPDSAGTSTCSEKKGFQLKDVKGDLFKCPPNHSLAHCISEDVHMGKGIATIFKKQFGGVEDLRGQGVKPGGVAVLERNGRYIYYLVTKEKYWKKPTYNSLQSSLEAMVAHCQSNNVTYVSMPRIGCGLDGLKWPTVSDIITQVFKDTDITVTVYTLEAKHPGPGGGRGRGRGGGRGGSGWKKSFQK